jgi:ParB family chromosome partitioning protein
VDHFYTAANRRSRGALWPIFAPALIFALRLALTGYVTIPNENELDYLAEAEALFVPSPPVKEKKPKKSPIPIKATPKKAATKKRVAA